jgi:adenosylhomocysteinase
LACEYLVKNKGKLESEVITLPAEIDDEIARMQLDAIGIKYDEMTPEQVAYQNEWREGT